MKNQPVDMHTFIVESYYEMRAWFRILSRGVMVAIAMGGLFSLFILITGIASIIQFFQDYIPYFSSNFDVKLIGQIIELVAIILFGTGGTVILKKTNPSGVFKMLNEFLDRDAQRSTQEPVQGICYECEKCGKTLSAKEIAMLEKGAPTKKPSEFCEDGDECLYHWGKTHLNNKEKEDARD